MTNYDVVPSWHPDHKILRDQKEDPMTDRHEPTGKLQFDGGLSPEAQAAAIVAADHPAILTDAQEQHRLALSNQKALGHIMAAAQQDPPGETTPQERIDQLEQSLSSLTDSLTSLVSSVSTLASVVEQMQLRSQR